MTVDSLVQDVTPKARGWSQDVEHGRELQPTGVHVHVHVYTCMCIFYTYM